MKKLIRQVGKSICYLFLFLGAQMTASICCGHLVSYAVRTFGNTENQMIAFLLKGYSFYVSAFSAMIALGLLWLVFRLQNKNMRDEIVLNKIPYSLILPLILLGMGMSLATDGVLQMLPGEILSAYSQASAVWASMPLIYTLLATGLCAPALEEIIFRGLIFTDLKKGMPSWAALLASAFLFGLCHGHPVWAAYAAIFGVVLGILTLSYHSILPGLLVHAVYNILGSFTSYLEGSAFSLVLLLSGVLLISISTVWLHRLRVKNSAI